MHFCKVLSPFTDIQFFHIPMQVPSHMPFANIPFSHLLTTSGTWQIPYPEPTLGTLLNFTPCSHEAAWHHVPGEISHQWTAKKIMTQHTRDTYHPARNTKKIPLTVMALLRSNTEGRWTKHFSNQVKKEERSVWTGHILISDLQVHMHLGTFIWIMFPLWKNKYSLCTNCFSPPAAAQHIFTP